MPLIWLPRNCITRELFLPILQREEVLEDVDLCDLSGQAAFTIKRPVPKFGIARFVQAACFTDRRERLMDQRWLWLDSFDPTQDLCRTVAPILPLLVRHVLLKIVIAHPFIMSR